MKELCGHNGRRAGTEQKERKPRLSADGLRGADARPYMDRFQLFARNGSFRTRKLPDSDLCARYQPAHANERPARNSRSFILKLPIGT